MTARPARPTSTGRLTRRAPFRFGIAGAAAALACSRSDARSDAEAAPSPSIAILARRMGTFEWMPTNSGPKGCPMQMIDGDFLFPRGGATYIPEALVHRGWGREGSLHVVGDARKPAPDSLGILFFSLLDDQLYQGAFALPRDSIARLLRDGYASVERPGRRGAYEMLVVGVTPGGGVAVWANGQERQTERFFGRARPVNPDWHAVMRAPRTVDRAAFVRESLTDAAELDPTVRAMEALRPGADRWAGFRTRYRWRPAFEGLGTPRTLERVEFANGERETIALPFDAEVVRAGRPAPSLVPFVDPRTNTYHRVRLDDDDEAAAAFRQLAAASAPVELVFTGAGGRGGAPMTVALRAASATVPLRKVTFE